MITIIPIAFVILLLIWGIVAYDRLVAGRLKVQIQWSWTDVTPKQWFDLILNLVETIKGYVAHEKGALQTVTDARSRYPSAGDAQGQMEVSTKLLGAMSRPMAVTEHYPELKASQNFLHLQQQIFATEEKLANHHQFYSDTVLRYSNLPVTVPADLIVGLSHLQKEELFKAKEAEKAAITVKL